MTAAGTAREAAGTARKAAGAAREAAVLREEIDQTRAALGQTVQALAERVDLPSRVRAATTRAAGRARQSAVPWLVLAGGVAGLVTAAVLIRRRGRR